MQYNIERRNRGGRFLSARINAAETSKYKGEDLSMKTFRKRVPRNSDSTSATRRPARRVTRSSVMQAKRSAKRKRIAKIVVLFFGYTISNLALVAFEVGLTSMFA